jgi:hypothetical protein
MGAGLSGLGFASNSGGFGGTTEIKEIIGRSLVWSPEQALRRPRFGTGYCRLISRPGKPRLTAPASSPEAVQASRQNAGAASALAGKVYQGLGRRALDYKTETESSASAAVSQRPVTGGWPPKYPDDMHGPYVSQRFR